MASNYKTPGVYVEEITTLPASVAGVETAIPAFVGYVQKADRDGEGIPMFTPTRITSFLEYQAIFGGADSQEFNIEVDDVTVNGNTTRTVTVDKVASQSPFRMYYNIRMYFSNGGGPCWIVPVGFYSLNVSIGVSKNDLLDGLNTLEKESEPTLLLYPDVLSLVDSEIKEVNEAALAQCNDLKNRFTIMDVKQDDPNIPNNDAIAFRDNLIGIDNLKYGATYYPYLDTTLNFGVSQLLLQITNYSLEVNGAPVTTDFTNTKEFNENVSLSIKSVQDALNFLKVATKTLTQSDAQKLEAFITGTVKVNINNADGNTPASPEFDAASTAINDIINNNILDDVETAASTFEGDRTKTNASGLREKLQILLDDLLAAMDLITDGYNNDDTDFIGGNLNYLQNNRPSIYTEVVSAINGYRVTLNPSGTMAGIYARVDENRGVWQSPANVGVRSVIGPSVLVTNDQQSGFNIDSASGKSINVIRNFTGRGTIVWGARTLDGNSNEWRYVNVRRLFIYLEESIKRASEFVVFEPNDANTWTRVKGMIGNFLTDVWKDGGLFGATAEEAFFVNVGQGTTMTPQDILEGRMIIEIGVAAVRPAEFIILRFTHFVQE